MTIFASGSGMNPTDPAGSGIKKRVMETLIYRVISVVGRKRTTVFESASFNEARKADDQYRLSLHKKGCLVTFDNKYFHPDTKKFEKVELEAFRR